MVLESINKSFNVSDDVETTIECHPDDVDDRYLVDLK